MANSAPFEILAGPLDCYFAPTGTPAPTTDEAVGTAWKLIGYTEGGVNVAHPQVLVEIRADQVTGPVKVIRSEESLEVTFSVASVTLANYALALNRALAGPSGAKVYLYRGGFQVETLSMLFRNEHLSPLGDAPLQYFVPVAFQADNPALAYTKDNKAVLLCSFHALVDPDRESDDESFGYLEAGGGA